MSMSIPKPAPPESESESVPRAPESGPIARLKQVKEFVAVVSTIAVGLAGLVKQFGGENEVLVNTIAGAITLVAVLAVLLRMYLRPATSLPVKPASTALILRGLVPFDEKDPLPARSTDVDTLAERVAAQGTLLFVIAGKPGSGKTSLVNAGLLPSLRSDGAYPVLIPEPGPNPTSAIGRGVASAVGAIPPSEEPAKLAEWLGTVAVQISESHPKGLVVICDHFERFARTATLAQQRGFAQEVWAAIRESQAPVRFLFVVSDYLKRDLLKLLSEGATGAADSVSAIDSFDVTALDRDEAKAVLGEIVGRGEARLDRRLRTTILDVFNGGGVSPAMLQVFVSTLRDAKICDLDGYRAVRGASGILGSTVVAAIRNAADPGLARLIVERVATAAPDGSAPEIAFDDLLTEYHGPSGAAKKARERSERETLVPLLQARILMRRGPQTVSLFDPILRGPARAAVAELADAQGDVARARQRLEGYVEQYNEDRRTCVPEDDLRFIKTHAPVDVLLGEPARTLLEASERTGVLLQTRRVAVGLGGLLLVTMALALIGLSIAATPSWQREVEFQVVDDGTTMAVEPGQMAIEPRRGIVMMSSIGDSLGLYVQRIPDDDGWAGLGVDWRAPHSRQYARRIDETKDTRFTSVAVDPMGMYFVTGGANGTIRVWNAEKLSLKATRPIREVSSAWDGMDERARSCEAIEGLSVGADGEYVLSATACGLVQLWKVRGTSDLEAAIKLDGKIVEGGLGVSKDGTTAAVLLRADGPDSPDRIAELTRAHGTFLQRTLILPTSGGTVVALGFGHDGRLVMARYTPERLEIGQFDDAGNYQSIQPGPSLHGVKKPSAVLSAQAETIGYKAWDAGRERPSVGWSVWRRGSDEQAREWELNDIRRPFLSADGSRLVLADDSVTSAVYRLNAWVGNVRVGWRHPSQQQ